MIDAFFLGQRMRNAFVAKDMHSLHAVVVPLTRQKKLPKTLLGLVPTVVLKKRFSLVEFELRDDMRVLRLERYLLLGDKVFMSGQRAYT